MKPVLQALVVADRVYQDVTGKKVIAGTFSGFKFSTRPPVAEIARPDGTTQRVLAGGMSAGSPYAYLCLTDVCDETTLLIQFLNLTKNVVLFGTQVTIQNTDRLRNVELVLPLPTLPVSEAGTYALEVLWEGEVLGSWRIIAECLDTPKEADENDTTDS